MKDIDAVELDYFVKRTIEKWDDLSGYVKPQWIYRGQRKATDSLKTSLERSCERFNVSFTDRPNIETELRREFRRAYHNYSVHVPDPKDVLEWLAVMQHHGAPTRLLDFSYSIYVATYFAIADADSESAVWAVNGQWAINQSVDLLKSSGKQDTDKLRSYFKEGDEAVVERHFMEPPYIACACPINPFRLNERLRVQQGVFLLSGTVTAPFMENLKALPNANSVNNVIRLQIPYDLRTEALKKLRDMNINHTSLFPGLDGFSKSLAVYHHVLADPDRTGIGTGSG